jgi:hypothetical protein
MLQTVYPGGSGLRERQSRYVPFQDSSGREQAATAV